MNEVEKMYENAGIEPDINYVCDKEPCGQHSFDDCQQCLHLYDIREDYPDFTAEKQLELIKWLIHYIKQINITDAISGEFYFTAFGYVGYMKVDFEEALASFINNLWQDLTEEERKQIKNILESEVRE